MASEMRGFVFAIVFIIVFSTLLATIPAGLQGVEETPDTVIPIDPNILTDFSAAENYSRPAFDLSIGIYGYTYSLGNKDWIVSVDTNAPAPYRLVLAQKVYVWIFWLGAVDAVSFLGENGDRGDTLSFAEIDTDAVDGTVRYSIQHVISGESAGGFIAYWNTTTYDNSTHAWDNDGLYLLHGIGFINTATNDIGALIVGLLFLQIPNVPVLVNMFLAVPIWACIVYVLWFVIKEMIPFVG